MNFVCTQEYDKKFNKTFFLYSGCFKGNVHVITTWYATLNFANRILAKIICFFSLFHLCLLNYYCINETVVFNIYNATKILNFFSNTKKKKIEEEKKTIKWKINQIKDYKFHIIQFWLSSREIKKCNIILKNISLKLKEITFPDGIFFINDV